MNKTFDPVTLEILWKRLITIVDEAATALRRSSFSPIVRESNDYACVLTDVEGNALAENTWGIPSFAGVLSTVIRRFLKEYPHDKWAPGDVGITNDPWIVSGHLPDISIIMPIFHKGKLIAFTGSIAHSADIGGSIWSADATEVFEEGLRIPPMKFIEAGKSNEALHAIISSNVRVPEQVFGDLYAQVSAGEVCAKGLLEFLEEENINLKELAQEIQMRAEASMRKSIEAIPDGEYDHFINADGYDKQLRIQAKIIIKGSNLTVDFEGTSSQLDRGINCVLNYTYAYTAYPIKCVLDPDAPRNEGSYKPIKVIAPKGSIVNPRFPAPVNGRQLIGHMITDVIYGCLKKVVPEKIIAQCGSTPTLRCVFSGIDLKGKKFSTVLFNNGGMGARPNADGLHCTPFPTNSIAGSMEVIEAVAPLVIWKKELLPDSFGSGTYRGGCGQEVKVELVSKEPATLSLFVERRFNPAQGVMGGMNGCNSEVTLNGKSSNVSVKGKNKMMPGDILSIKYPGGGGYGPPAKRSREFIAEDIENEILSLEKAKNDFNYNS